MTLAGLSRSRLDCNKIMIRIIIIVKCYSWDIFSEKLGISNYMPPGNSGRLHYYVMTRPCLGLLTTSTQLTVLTYHYSAGDPGIFRRPWRAFEVVTCVV
ncbi:hypothetical protein TNCV_3147491 [Trichonephila clavipes]|nr:hypothetical protein TNCV_3147491 [Trichonephila clavipes]